MMRDTRKFSTALINNAERFVKRATNLTLGVPKIFHQPSMSDFYESNADLISWRHGQTFGLFLNYGFTLLLYWIGGAFLFWYLNHDTSIFHSFYFCMITLATIGKNIS